MADRVRFATPDTVIGIGGAGKEVVFTLMEQEWVLREVIEPREDDNDAQLEAFVVDTETDFQSEDEARAGTIEDTIGKLADEYSEAVQRPDVEYINIVDENNYTSANQLVNSGVVNDIAADTGINCWWLRRNSTMLDLHSNYADGVVRRRALSKALFHSSRVGADPLNNAIRTAGRGNHVALVVGLGGGTGSGMFLDIAKQLRENVDVDATLFAILPKPQEPRDIGANAYAALSELEYLALTHQNPFQNVVLLPYGPAVDEQEFDEAIAQTLLAYYNLEGNKADRLNESKEGMGPARYAPFTLAVPQIRRYDASGIRQSQRNFDSYIEEKTDALEVEAELLDQFEALLEHHYADGDGSVYEELTEYGSDPHFSLSEYDVPDLEDRLERVEDLVNQEILERLGYDAVSHIREELSETRRELLQNEDVDEDDRSEVVRTVVNELPDVVVDKGLLRPTGGFDTTKDERITELVERELETLIRRRECLKAKNMLVEHEDAGAPEFVTDAIEVALDDTQVGRAVNIDDELDDATKEVKRVESEIEDLATLRDGAQEYAETQLDEWRADVEEDVGKLINLAEQAEEVEALVDSLESALRAATQAVEDAERPEDVPQRSLNFSEYAALQEKLDAIGLGHLEAASLLDRNTVETSVEKAREARRHRLAASADGGGVVEAIRSTISGGSTDEELMHEYAASRGNVEHDLVSIAEWDAEFYCDVNDALFSELRTKLDSHREELVEAVVDSLHDRAGDPPVGIEGVVSRTLDDSAIDNAGLLDELPSLGVDATGYVDDVRRALTDVAGTTAPELLDSLCQSGEHPDQEEGAVRRAMEAAYVAPVEDLLADKRDRSDAAAEKRERYERLSELLDVGTDFVKRQEGIRDPEDIGEYDDGADADRPFIQRVSAQQRGRLLGREDIDDANLWDDSVERSHIEDAFVDFAERVTNFDEHAPLSHGTIGDEGMNLRQSMYSQHRIMTMYMSRMFSEDVVDGPGAEMESVRSTLVGSGGMHIDASNDNYIARRVKFGGPWDASLVVFVGGVMLDNLEVLKSRGGGYRNAYEEEIERLNENMIVRHTHGVDGLDEGEPGLDLPAETGAYVRREKLLNLNRPEGIELLLDTEENELLEELLDRYEKTTFETTVDIGVEGDEY